MIYTKYDLGASQVDGILHTNIQKGKGYCFFEEIDLILPVESDTDLFLERGHRVRVMYLESEVVGKSKKYGVHVQEIARISSSIMRCVKMFLKETNEKSKDSKNEESEPLERFEDSSIATLEQRLTELLEECRKLDQEIQDLKMDLNNLKKNCKNIKKGD